MKIKNIFFIVILFIIFTSNAQITKGNWMMGGSLNLSSDKNTSNGYVTHTTGIDIKPNVGYFVIDKLALGADTEIGIFSNRSTIFGIAPFIRYYFLEKEKKINIFSEFNYEFRKNYPDNYISNRINFKTGAVFFLNSSVGIEMALNYSTLNTNQNSQYSGINLGVGFQIHLERE